MDGISINIVITLQVNIYCRVITVSDIRLKWHNYYQSHSPANACRALLYKDVIKKEQQNKLLETSTIKSPHLSLIKVYSHEMQLILSEEIKEKLH